MARVWTDYVVHIYSEANGCANAQANKGCEQQCFLEVCDICSSFVYSALVWDMKQLGTF